MITPESGWGSLSFTELSSYRDLFWYLSWRNVAVRYKQTLFGVVWALLQPLAASGIFTIFLGHFAKVPSDGRPYFLFTFCAMLPWTFFRNTVSQAALSLVQNAQLVTKVYFPRIFVPASTAPVGLIDLTVTIAALIPALAFYGVNLSSRLFLAPIFLLGVTVCAIGVGTGLAAINVRFRDVRFTIPFLMQCWMFATPIVYPSSVIPAKYRHLLGLNPLAGFIEGFRASLLDLPIPWDMVLFSSLVTALLFVFGLLTFRRTEHYFADVI